MACEDYGQLEDDAQEVLERAHLATESAQDNLDAAELSWASAVFAQVACLLTIETGPGFVVCEASAFLAAEAAAKWIESALAALELAEAAESDAAEAWALAQDAYCDCLREGMGPGDYPEPDELRDGIEQAETAVEEAEQAVAAAEADGEEAETLLAEAEEALDDAESDPALVG